MAVLRRNAGRFESQLMLDSGEVVFTDPDGFEWETAPVEVAGIAPSFAMAPIAR